MERAVAPYRRLLEAEAKATVRFETPPGRQLQIDFGERRVPVADGTMRAHLFVATLGYSRRTYAKVFANQRQSSWFAGLEGAFLHFGGVTDEVLVDNPKPLVARHDPATREVEFNERFLVFAAHLGVPAPGVRPVPGADQGQGRERRALRQAQRDRGPPLRQPRVWKPICPGGCGRSPFGQLRDLVRTVHADCAVTVDTNAYSVPWQLIGERVQVVASGGKVRVHHGKEVVRNTTSTAAGTGGSSTGRISTASTRVRGRSTPGPRRHPRRRCCDRSTSTRRWPAGASEMAVDHEVLVEQLAPGCSTPPPRPRLRRLRRDRAFDGPRSTWGCPPLATAPLGSKGIGTMDKAWTTPPAACHAPMPAPPTTHQRYSPEGPVFGVATGSVFDIA